MLIIYRLRVSPLIASACLLMIILFLSGEGYPSFDKNVSADSKPVPDSQESNAGSGITSKNIIPLIGVVLPEDHETSANGPENPARATDNTSETQLAEAESSVSTSDDATVAQSSSVSTLGTGTVNVVSNISALSEETVKPVQITPAGNTGAATASIPIKAPPGRKGIGPNLSLNYNSNTRNGWLGVGWSLNTGAIQRNAKLGVNYNGNDYVFTVNGSSFELVPRGDWGPNYFGAKIEGGFSKYYKNPFGGWIVTTKDGTKFFYGTTSTSRQDNIHGIFKWCLDRVEDTNGNYMEIYYTRDQVNGEIYLDEIKYTGNTVGLTPSNSIKFLPDLTPRTDKPTMFAINSAVKTTERLGEIEVYGNGQLTRRYELQYQYSPNTGRSLLSSITQFGGGGSELPSTTFVYSSGSSSFLYGTWSQNNFGISPYNAFRAGDFNGDGKRDTAFSFSFDYDQCRNECQQNCEPDCSYTCENFCEDSCQDFYSSCDFECYNICDDYCENNVCTDDYVCDLACQSEEDYDLCFEDCLEDPYQFINDCRDNCEPSCMDSCEDSCRDAYQSCKNSCADICEDPCRQSCDDSCDQGCWDSCGTYCYYYGAEDNTWVGISGTNGLIYSSWHQNGLDVEPYIPLAGDFNGDGKSDIVFYDGRTWVGISNGSGFNFSIWSQINFGINPYSAIAVGDFNGDGLSDVVFYHEDGNTWVGISTGNGFNFSIWNQTGFGSQPYKAFRVGDFNADGLSDVAFYYENGNTWVGLSNGSSFTYSVWSQNGFGTQPYETFSVGDFNGDGLGDVAFYYENGNTWVGMSTGSSFNYSVWSNNGFGTEPYETFRVDDFNGDGLSDVVFYYENGNTWVGISNGANFTYSVWSQNGFGTKPYEAFGTGDFNGDGKSDVIFYYEDGNTYVGLSGPSSPNSLPDLLYNISNGIGGSTTIEYHPSSDYDNCIDVSGKNVCLPFIVQTLSTVTIDDGNNTSSITTYDYSGGYFDYTDREFRGFEYVTVTAYGATAYETLHAETRYYQDDVKKGLTAEQTTKDSPGDNYNIFTKTVNTYETEYAPYTGVDFPRLNQQDKFICDRNCTEDNKYTLALRSKAEFTYDNYGNITDKKLYRKTALETLDREEQTEYYPDGYYGNWLVSLPQAIYIKDGSGTTKARTNYTYYPTGNLHTESKWNDSGSPDPVTTYEYDLYGNVWKVTDPINIVAMNNYDPATHTFPVKITNDLNGFGYFRETTYDDVFIDKVHIETDYNGNQIQYDYDVFGRIEKITKPFPYGITRYAYDDINRIKTIDQMDRAENILQWKKTYYDGLGRTIRTRSSGRYGDGTDAAVIVVDTRYDERGQAYTKSNPYFEGAQYEYDTVYTYDALNRLINILNPDGTSSSASYDRGWETYIDANSHRKDIYKDIYGQTVTVNEYTGDGTTEKTYVLYATTTYEYDVLGNLKKVTDVNGNQTTMVYDSLSRKKEMNDPDMGRWYYDYDTNGNLIYQKNATDQEITFDPYDTLNRVTKKNYPDGSYIEYIYDEAFSSNSIGRLTTVTRADSAGTPTSITKTYYDEVGNVTQTDRTIGSSGPYITHTAYDVLGRISKITYPDTMEVNYTYDGHGNIHQILTGGVPYVTYNEYNANTQPTSVTYANGTSTIYQYYNENNRLYSITTGSLSAGVLMNLSYGYDSAGNITSLTDPLTYPDGKSRSRVYKYDEFDRLIESDSPSYGGKLLYQYDKIGNMTYNCKYGYYYYEDPSHVHAVTAIKMTDGTLVNTYSYDPNGNMYAGAARGLTYDYDNVPTRITYGSTYVDSVYDADGQRIKKVTPNSTSIYIGQTYECTNGMCTKNIMSGTQIIAQVDNAGIYFYHTDHLGSSSIITDSTGNEVEDIYYYPYGEIKTNEGSVNVRYKFTGKEYDAEDGLYYYGARYYDPKLARFISADTIVPDYTTPQSLNRYSYVLNNPLNLIDPSGNYYEETEKGYQEYVGPSIEENADRDAYLAELYYGSGINFDFSGLSFIPILRMEHDRYLSIINNTTAIFPIADNPNAASTPPWYQLGYMNDVHKYDNFIQRSASSYGVDAELVKSIMYLETTHGYYDRLFAIFDLNSSVLPMNVQAPRWDALGTNRDALKNPKTNIDIGVKLISRIQERVLDPTPAKVGTLYHSLSQERVDDYGGRLNYYYFNKPWDSN